MGKNPTVSAVAVDSIQIWEKYYIYFIFLLWKPKRSIEIGHAIFLKLIGKWATKHLNTMLSTLSYLDIQNKIKYLLIMLYKSNSTNINKCLWGLMSIPLSLKNYWTDLDETLQYIKIRIIIKNISKNLCKKKYYYLIIGKKQIKYNHNSSSGRSHFWAAKYFIF